MVRISSKAEVRSVSSHCRLGSTRERRIQWAKACQIRDCSEGERDMTIPQPFHLTYTNGGKLMSQIVNTIALKT